MGILDNISSLENIDNVIYITTNETNNILEVHGPLRTVLGYKTDQTIVGLNASSPSSANHDNYNINYKPGETYYRQHQVINDLKVSFICILSVELKNGSILFMEKPIISNKKSLSRKTYNDNPSGSPPKPEIETTNSNGIAFSYNNQIMIAEVSENVPYSFNVPLKDLSIAPKINGLGLNTNNSSSNINGSNVGVNQNQLPGVEDINTYNNNLLNQLNTEIVDPLFGIDYTAQNIIESLDSVITTLKNETNKENSNFSGGFLRVIKPPSNQSNQKLSSIVINLCEELIDVKVDVDYIIRCAKYIGSVITNQMDLPKLKAKSVELQFSTVNLKRDVIIPVVQMIFSQKSESIYPNISVNENLEITTDPSRLQQLLQSLLATASRATQTGSITVKANTIDVPHPEIMNIVIGKYKGDHMITIVNALAKYLNTNVGNNNVSGSRLLNSTGGVVEYERKGNQGVLSKSSSTQSLNPSSSVAALHNTLPLVRQVLHIHIEATAENIHQFQQFAHESQNKLATDSNMLLHPIQSLSKLSPLKGGSNSSFKESIARDVSNSKLAGIAPSVSYIPSSAVSLSSKSHTSNSHKGIKGVTTLPPPITVEQLLNPSIYPWLELPCLLVELMNAELSISFGPNKNNSNTSRGNMSSKSLNASSAGGSSKGVGGGLSSNGSNNNLSNLGVAGLEIDIFVPIISQDSQLDVLQSGGLTGIQGNRTKDGSGTTNIGAVMKRKGSAGTIATLATVTAISSANDNSWSSRRGSPRPNHTTQTTGSSDSTVETKGEVSNVTTPNHINIAVPNSSSTMTNNNGTTFVRLKDQKEGLTVHMAPGTVSPFNTTKGGGNYPATPNTHSYSTSKETPNTGGSNREKDYEDLIYNKISFRNSNTMSPLQDHLSSKLGSDRSEVVPILLTLDETTEFSKTIRTVQNLRILIIEENPIVAKMRQRMLQVCLRSNSRTKMTNNIFVTVTCEETLELCEKEHGRFDVVLVSHKIPTGVPSPDKKTNNNNTNNAVGGLLSILPSNNSSADDEEAEYNKLANTKTITTGFELVKKLRDGEGTREKMTNVVIIGCISGVGVIEDVDSETSSTVTMSRDTQMFHKDRFYEAGCDSVWMEPFQSIDTLIQDISSCRVKKLGVGAQLPGNKKLLLVGHVPSTIKMFTTKLKKVLPTSWRIDGVSELEKVKPKLLEKQIYYDIIIANEGDGVLGSEFFRSMRTNGHLGLLIGFSAGDNEKKFRECGADLFWSKLNNNSSDVYISYFLKEEHLMKINAPRPICLYMKRVEQYFNMLNDASIAAAANYNESFNPFKDRLKARALGLFIYETKEERKKRKNRNERENARAARFSTGNSSSSKNNTSTADPIRTSTTAVATVPVPVGVAEQPTIANDVDTSFTSVTTAESNRTSSASNGSTPSKAAPPTQPPPASSVTAMAHVLSTGGGVGSSNKGQHVPLSSHVASHLSPDARSKSSPQMIGVADVGGKDLEGPLSPTLSDSAINRGSSVNLRLFSPLPSVKHIMIKESSDFEVQIYQPNYPPNRFRECLKKTEIETNTLTETSSSSDLLKQYKLDKEAESKWFEGYSYALDSEGKGTGGGYMLGYGNTAGERKKETFPGMKRRGGRKMQTEDEDEGDY